MVWYRKPKPALVLDLDGTVRRATGKERYPTLGHQALFDGVEELLWNHRDDGWLILGATNQGGVAFGAKTPEGFAEEIEEFYALFERNPFHDLEASFAHPRGRKLPWRGHSLLRKPGYGMLALLEQRSLERGYPVDWASSRMVGDRTEDEGCAKAAGISFSWAWDFFPGHPGEPEKAGHNG